MPTIESRHGRQGQKHYRVKIRCDGVVRSATFPTLKEARDWAYVTEGTLRTQRYAPRREAAYHTLGELLQRYGQEVLSTKSPGTVAHQRQHLRWWTEQLGVCCLLEVSPPRLVACRDLLAARYAPGTVNQYLATLSHALTVAVTAWQWLEASPMPAVRRLREPRGRVRFLTEEERLRLLEACQHSRNRFLAPVVVVALSTGARKMEILSLRWPDVDVKRGLLTFHQTKNGERRTVPLTGQALTLMQHHTRVRRIDTPLVFARSDGRAPIDIRSAWKHVLCEARIADCRFHDLRHSAASYLAMQGASLVELAEILGHKTVAMVQRYTHLSEAHTRRVVERMNAAIFP